MPGSHRNPHITGKSLTTARNGRAAARNGPSNRFGTAAVVARTFSSVITYTLIGRPDARMLRPPVTLRSAVCGRSGRSMVRRRRVLRLP
jgi:hypothetical protein